MAIKTQAQLLAEVDTLLNASSPKVRKSLHLAFEQNLIDTMFPYKKYVALLTQAGTDAPVASIIKENTLGEVPTFSYLGVGKFKMNSALGQFYVDKTIIDYNAFTHFDNFDNQVTMAIDDQSGIFINTYAGGVASDDALPGTWVKIYVYYS